MGIPIGVRKRVPASQTPTIWIKKPFELIESEAREQSLKRVLGGVSLVFLGIGATIGTGIFVLTGSTSARFAGPAIVISVIIAAGACALSGLCYAEFASLLPIAGSVYTYSYAILGEIVAWIMGWVLILEYSLGAATVASGWSGYALSLMQDFGIHFPVRLTGPPGTEFVFYNGNWEVLDRILPTLQSLGIEPVTLPHKTGLLNLVAFLVIWGITLVLLIGIKESAEFNSFVVGLKISALLVFIGIGATFLLHNPSVRLANWHPFVPVSNEFGKLGWSGVFHGAAIMFFAYIGFDAVSTAAQEARNPQRDMPIGLLGSLGICAALYVLVAGTLTGVVNYTHLNIADPLAVAVDETGHRYLSLFVKFGATIGLTSVMMVMLLGQSRIFFSMANDGLCPGWGARIHTRYRTPYISSIVIGAFVSLFAAVLPISVLSEVVSIATLLAFTVVCIAVPILRKTHAHLPRSFKTPLVPLLPLLGVAVLVLLMASLSLMSWICLGAWIALGLCVYFVYGQKNSRLRNARL